VLNGSARSVLLGYAAALAAGSPFVAAWELVSDWQAPYGVPEPVDVRLNVRSALPFAAVYQAGQPALASFPPPIIEGYCGQFCQASGAPGFDPQRSALNAAWRIRWGAGGEERVMVCDLKTARYCLGACTRVTVEALRWQDTTAPTGTAFDIVASSAVLTSGGAQGDEPTVTITNSYGSSAEFVGVSVIIPNFARWWVPVFDARDNAAFWGTANPDFTFTGFGEAVTVSPSSSQITPAKHRYEVAPPWFSSNALSNNAPPPIGKINSGVASTLQDLVLGVRFYLAI
jgi:hypothetical protein